MSWMVLPVLATVVIVLTLGWFGLHVLERGVIFVDLALAQVAALGTTAAVFLGHDPDSSEAFAMALAATLVGAAAFSLTRLFEERVPQEAIIGVAYAVSAASGMLLIHFADDAHGGEELEHLLVGNIVWVGPGDVALLAGVCGAVGLLHAVARRPFLAVTQRTGSVAHAALWDLLFYASFGLALTAIVSVAGVLLVFSTLVIPAVIARLLVVGVLARLLVAWGVGLGVGIAGVAVSYTHPTGPVIVALLGAALLVTLVVWAVRQATSPGAAIARVLGASALLAAAAAAFSALPVRTEHDHHEAPEDVAPTPADGLFSLDAAVRDATARQAAGNPDRVPAMERALALETDAAVRLTLAVALARSGDVHALQALAELTQCDVPYVRMEADARLRAVAGKAAPAYDPLAGPDEAGRWRAWAASVQKAPPGLTALPLP